MNGVDDRGEYVGQRVSLVFPSFGKCFRFDCLRLKGLLSLSYQVFQQKTRKGATSLASQIRLQEFAGNQIAVRAFSTMTQVLLLLQNGCNTRDVLE